MKQAVMTAHDAILETHVKQTWTMNRKRRLAPFRTGDLAYISIKNISLPRGQAQKLVQKLVPKFIGPYQINRDFGNNSFEMDLPLCLCQQGIHPVFHLSLLWVHMLNDDHLFPGRLENQVADFGESEPEWAIDYIISHCGSGVDANLEVRWMSGDLTWIPYSDVCHLSKVSEYLELVGITNVKDLPWGRGDPPKEAVYLFNAVCMPCFQQPHSSQVQPIRSMRPLTNDLSKSYAIYCSGDDFVFFDSGTGGSFTVPRANLQLCLIYSKRIRTEVFTDCLKPAPIGYFLVARTFNNELSVKSSFSLFNDEGRCLTSLRPEPHPLHSLDLTYCHLPPLPHK